MNWPDCWKKMKSICILGEPETNEILRCLNCNILYVVCICACMCIYACAYTCGTCGGQHPNSGVFPNFSILFSEINLTWSLKFVASTNLADQQVPGILTSLCPECEITARTWVFTWVLGTRAKIYMQERQSLYGLGHLPSPYIQYYWLHILLL